MHAAVRDTLNMRIKPEDRALFDHAAKAEGKTRTDFILEAARRAAEEALLDRILVQVGPEACTEFLDRLDAPPRPTERLKTTMRTSAPRD